MRVPRIWTCLWASARKNGAEVFRESGEYFLLDAGQSTVDDGMQGDIANTLIYTGTGWTHCTNCGDDGTLSDDATAGDTATVTFTGTRVALYGVSGPGQGIAALSISGGTETLVDSYNPVASRFQLLWASPPLEPGQHTLQVRVTGTHFERSGGSDVAIDRVDIGA